MQGRSKPDVNGYKSIKSRHVSDTLDVISKRVKYHMWHEQINESDVI